MTKLKAFISYSSKNKDKVDIIYNELKDSSTIKPVIIARSNEPCNPLVEKVKKGIEESQLFIPILTKKSLSTQWINQEIGYAFAKNKVVYPIVESDIIDDLKGFIHNQIDLPYSYKNNDNLEIENKSFLEQLQEIIKDISKNNPSPNKDNNSLLQSQIKLYQESQSKIETKEKKMVFLSSQEGLDASKNEFYEMFKYIEAKIIELRGEQIYISFERESYEPYLILQSGTPSKGYSIGFFHNIINQDSYYVPVASLIKWKGIYSYNNNSVIFPSDYPNELESSFYHFDIDGSNNYYWKKPNDKIKYSSFEIIDLCLSWLIKKLLDNR